MATASAQLSKVASAGVKVTFAHQVTRDELILSLDQILNQYGCPNCGLNGLEHITLMGDPDPIYSRLEDELLSEKFRSVVNVQRDMPSVQQLGQQL